MQRTNDRELYGFEQSGGVWALVMELMEGSTLASGSA
jgi:hypothetical protein